MERGEGGGEELPMKRNQPETPPPPTTTTVTAAVTVTDEVPTTTRKLARQLDFNTTGPVTEQQPRVVQAQISTSSSLHHQYQNQNQLFPQMQVQNQGLIPRPIMQPMMQPAMGMMPETAAAQGLVRPIVKPDPLRQRPRPGPEVKESTPKRAKHCNCKHSRCLKLYCECFASGVYCEGCNCLNCCNNLDNDAARKEAVGAILERNPNAFRPKIASSPREERHHKGCHCKKSGCLKKYCECFQAGIFCSENCKCQDCKNFEESEERQALFHDPIDNLVFMQQQAANAAITGAIGSSGFMSTPVSKKRKEQEQISSAKELSIHRPAQFSQANHVRPSGPSSSISSAVPSAPAARNTDSGVPGSSKPAYRSLLADIVQPIDLNVLIATMVTAAQKVAENFAVARRARANGETGTGTDVPKSAVTDPSGGEQADKVVADGSSPEDAADGSRSRPMSPETLALMCDEQDTTLFMVNGSTGDATSALLPERRDKELYAEQERVVLTILRDLLVRIVQASNTKSAEYEYARLESVAQDEPISNGTVPSRADNGTRQDPPAISGHHPILSSTIAAARSLSNDDHHKVNGESEK